MTLCCIPGCRNELTTHAKYPACTTCRAGMHRTYRLTPYKIMERRRKLIMYRARIETVVPIAVDAKNAKKADDPMYARKLLTANEVMKLPDK